MIDFERFWLDGERRFESYLEGRVAADWIRRPGVAAADIGQWEERHGVTLPEPLRTALRVRNGGLVRNAPIRVLPLEEILPTNDDFCEHNDCDDVEDRRLLFAFGENTDTRGIWLMNFNARGPREEPSVFIHHAGLVIGNTFLFTNSISGLFEAELASDAEPSVDWSETEILPRLACESTDLASMYGGRPASREQVLSRVGDSLVLFTHERSPSGESLTRNTLPLPLNGRQAYIMPMTPTTPVGLGLRLEPFDRARSEFIESEMNDDGRWKNWKDRGVFRADHFYSMDRQRLEALRLQLVDAESAARNAAAERELIANPPTVWLR